MAEIIIKKKGSVVYDVETQSPPEIDLKKRKIEVEIDSKENIIDLSIVKNTKPTVSIGYGEESAAIDALAAAEEARRKAEEAAINAAYAKEMGDRAKEIIDSGGGGLPHHEVTEEEMNAILDEIDGEDYGENN